MYMLQFFYLFFSWIGCDVDRRPVADREYASDNTLTFITHLTTLCPPGGRDTPEGTDDRASS